MCVCVCERSVAGQLGFGQGKKKRIEKEKKKSYQDVLHIHSIEYMYIKRCVSFAVRIYRFDIFKKLYFLLFVMRG